ncbi:unnamed protein product [Closterium sp. NIES-65]|nr:unnamed protein product [Closterium sp. NIES-65]
MCTPLHHSSFQAHRTAPNSKRTALHGTSFHAHRTLIPLARHRTTLLPIPRTQHCTTPPNPPPPPPAPPSPSPPFFPPAHPAPPCQTNLQGGQQPITAPAKLLVPTNVGHWQYLAHWTALSPTHQRRLLRYHILPGRYTAQQLLDAPQLTLFPTFNHRLPLNRTLKPEEVYFQSVPPMKSASPLSVPDAGLTAHLAAHGVTFVLEPPNLECTTVACNSKAESTSHMG